MSLEFLPNEVVCSKDTKDIIADCCKGFFFLFPNKLIQSSDLLTFDFFDLLFSYMDGRRTNKRINEWISGWEIRIYYINFV